VIDEITLGNFKSIRAAKVPLSPFTCLIGPNNSGKSNLLSALRFLQGATSQGLQPAIAAASGESLRYFGAKSDERVSLGIRISVAATTESLPFQSYRYQLSFALDSSGTVSESLHGLSSSGEETELAKSVGSFRGGTRQATIREAGRQSGPLRDRLIQLSGQTLLVSAPSPVVGPMRDSILGMRFFHFSPGSLKQPGQVAHQTRLDYEGTNFATYFHYIHSGNKRVFQRIEEQLVKNFPDVEELISPITPQGTAAGIRERWFDKSVSGGQLSDGLAGFLAHLVVLYGPDSPTLVSFEEPENYVNPRLLERLVAMLRSASQQSQVLITTHSTSLLNRLDLSEILVVEREKGETNVRRAADSSELREHLKDWALGDAYVSGALGGVP
jgi:predicted ATPase